jgi:general secretion pathway protein C
VLETLFRKRFFVVHLVLSALLAFLLARTVTAVASQLLLAKVVAMARGNEPAAGRAAVPRSTGTLRDFVAAANANIFEGRREVTVEEPGAAAAASPVMSGDWRDAPKSALRLRLVGTTAFSEPKYSLASIIDESQAGAGAGLYSINDCVTVDRSGLSEEDAKLLDKPPPCKKVGELAQVLRIEPERVFVLNVADARIEYLALNEPPAAGGEPPPLARVEKTDEKPGEGKDIGEGITKTGENSFGVPRSAVDGALNNLSELATQARIVPAFEGGKPVGFKLFSIKPGSLYSKIGLQNGDVVNRINGFEMSSPEKGLEVYQKLKDSSNVTVDIKRRGKPMTLDYTIH